MKEFRYKHGRIAGQTLTVKELREVLSQYPDDMPVIAAWEGQHAYIKEREVESVCKGMEEDRADCLVFDVEQT